MIDVVDAGVITPEISSFDEPRLLADIGGTNARFTLESDIGKFNHVTVLACADYPRIQDALKAYLSLTKIAGGRHIRHAAIAIANPVIGDLIAMTNHHWQFSIEALRQEMGFDTLIVVNDFSALAMALPSLTSAEKLQVGGGVAIAGAPIGLLGAGTGLGVSGLVSLDTSTNGVTSHWTALQSEGGHVTFSPADEIEVAILHFAWDKFEHVSAERFLSGAGIELIYQALVDYYGLKTERLTAPEITSRALSKECLLCEEVFEVFCGMLGTAAGNLATTLGALGGIYIGGGIVPRFALRFSQSCFRSRFERKGRLVGYLAQVPTYVITAQYPAFLGVSAILNKAVTSSGTGKR